MIIILFITLFLSGCGSSKGPNLSPEPTRKVMKNIPDWYIKTPKKEGFRYAGATATSRDLQLAVNKATQDAATQLAGSIDSEMNALVKRVREETGVSTDSDILDRFSQTQEQIISTSHPIYSPTKLNYENIKLFPIRNNVKKKKQKVGYKTTQPLPT